MFKNKLKCVQEQTVQEQIGVRGRGTQSSAERHFVSKGSPARPCVSVLDRSCISSFYVRNAQARAENSVAAGLPFREKVPFSLNSTHFHENGGISPFWGFFAKSATLRAKAPFGAPSREVALNLRNIDGFGSHFPPKALLGPKSSHCTEKHQFS